MHILDKNILTGYSASGTVNYCQKMNFSVNIFCNFDSRKWVLGIF